MIFFSKERSSEKWFFLNYGYCDSISVSEFTEIVANFQTIKGQLFGTGELETEQSQLQEELNVVAELIQQCVRENAHVALDQTEYQARYNGLAERFDRTKARLDEVDNAITEKQAKKEQIERFLAELKRFISFPI